MADDIVFSIEHGSQCSHIVLLRLMIRRMHQPPAFISMPGIIRSFYSIPLAIFPVMLLVVVMPFTWTVRDKRPMVPVKLGARRAVVSRVLPAVIRAGVVIGHVGHKCLVSFYFLVYWIVLNNSKFLLRATSVYPALLRSYLRVRVVNILAAVVMMVLASVLIFVVFSEYHFLAPWGMLGHVDVGVPEVVVVASCCLVSLVVERALLVLDGVSRGARSVGGYFTLVVGAMKMVLLGQLTRESVVMRQRRCAAGMVFRRSVLWNR